MFDIGFSELLLVALVALIVLGPQRLPGAIRTTGLIVGRIKRSFNSIKDQVEKEIGADEIRRQLHNERILEMERELKRDLERSAAQTSSSTPAAPSTPDSLAKDPAEPKDDSARRPPA